MNMILKVDNHPTILTKEKAEKIAAENNSYGGEETYAVRVFNESQKTYVVDVIEGGEVVFTL